MPSAHEQRVEGRVARSLVQVGAIRKVVNENQDLVQLLHLHLLGHLRDLALLVDDAAQGRFVPVLEVDLLPVCVHLHGFFDVLLDGPPAVVHVDARRKEVDALEAAPVLFKNHGDQGHRLARLRGTDKDPSGGELRHHRVVGLLALVVWGREDLDLPHACALPTALGSTGRSSTSAWLSGTTTHPSSQGVVRASCKGCFFRVWSRSACVVLKRKPFGSQPGTLQ